MRQTAMRRGITAVFVICLTLASAQPTRADGPREGVFKISLGEKFLERMKDSFGDNYKVIALTVRINNKTAGKISFANKQGEFKCTPSDGKVFVEFSFDASSAPALGDVVSDAVIKLPVIKTMNRMNRELGIDATTWETAMDAGQTIKGIFDWNSDKKQMNFWSEKESSSEGKEAKVDFEKDIVDKEVFSEELETIPGVSRTFSVERSYERSLTITGTVGVEASSRVTLGSEAIASISGEIKGRVETSLGITLGKKETVTESIMLDGKDVTKVNIKWVERYRKGTATLSDGRKVEVLVCVGLRLKVAKPK